MLASNNKILTLYNRSNDYTMKDTLRGCVMNAKTSVEEINYILQLNKFSLHTQKRRVHWVSEQSVADVEHENENQ